MLNKVGAIVIPAVAVIVTVSAFLGGHVEPWELPLAWWCAAAYAVMLWRAER